MFGDIVSQITQQRFRIGLFEHARDCPHEHGIGAKAFDRQPERGELVDMLFEPIAIGLFQLHYFRNEQRLACGNFLTGAGRAQTLQNNPLMRGMLIDQHQSIG